jgi:carbon-monoxide dehydrogenase medium subunit
MSTEWLAPTSLQEALELRARYADDATVVAGGTFIGILMSQRLIAPSAFLSLRGVRELVFITTTQEDTGEHGQQLPRQVRIGAMTTHRALERSAPP